MPKVKITTETADVLKQAEAAANDPVLTPLETQCVQDLMQPTLDAIDNAQPDQPDQLTPEEQQYIAQLPMDEQQHIAQLPIENQKVLAKLYKKYAEIDRNLIFAEDYVANLKAQKKGVKDQMLDAYKSKPALYKARLQNSFNF